MSEIKIHDPNIVSIERHPGDSRFIIRYKDGKEKFVEDEPMKNTREYNKRILDDLSHLSFGSYFEDLTEDQKEIVKRNYDKHVKISNPRKKYRELLKPARPGNYQKIMKEIDEKPNEWRFRLLPPGKFEEFRYDDVTTGVRAIAGCPKGQWSKGKCKVGMQYQALRLSKEVFKTKESAAKWLASHTMEKYGKNPRVPRAFDRDTEMMIGDLMNVGVPEHKLRKLSKSQIGRAHREHFAKEYGDIELDEIS